MARSGLIVLQQNLIANVEDFGLNYRTRKGFAAAADFAAVIDKKTVEPMERIIAGFKSNRRKYEMIREEKEGRDTFKINPTRKVKEEIRRNTVRHWTLSIEKKDIEMSLTKDIEKCLKNIISDVSFYTNRKMERSFEAIFDSVVDVACKRGIYNKK